MDQQNQETTEAPAPASATIEERVSALESKLREFGVRLFGDAEAKKRYEEEHAKWEQAVKTYVTPRGDEPRPPKKGDVDTILDALVTVSDTLKSSERMLRAKMAQIEELDRARFAALDRITKWVGPLLDDPNFAPPLNGAMIASKKYVDEAIERFAGRIREHVSPAVHLAERLARAGAALTDHDLVDGESRIGGINRIVDAIQASWSWIADEIQARNRPSRAQIARRALAALLTGKE